MLNGVPGGDPLTFSIAVVAAAAAGLLVYRDANRHDHYHALSASAAVAIAALVGFVVANVVGLAVATGYVLLLYLLSYPSTPGVDGEVKRRRPDRPDGRPQGDAGEALTGPDDVVSVIRVEVASAETLRELAASHDDVPDDAPTRTLRSMLRVKALRSALESAEADDALDLGDWSRTGDTGSVDDWHGADDVGDAGEARGSFDAAGADDERPAESAAAWNAATARDEGDDEAVDVSEADDEADPFTWAEVEASS